MEPRKHYFAKIPTIAIFIVFAMSTPLGVLLFILKSIDKNAEKEEKAAAQAQADRQCIIRQCIFHCCVCLTVWYCGRLRLRDL